MYGSPKNHKPEVPLKPTVSCTGSMTCNAAKTIDLEVPPPRTIFSVIRRGSTAQEDKQKIVQIYASTTLYSGEDITSFFYNDDGEIFGKPNHYTIMMRDFNAKVRRSQKVGQDRLISLLDKHGIEIYDQDKIKQRIEEYYTELYDSEQSTIIHIGPKEVLEITYWKVEAAL